MGESFNLFDTYEYPKYIKGENFADVETTSPVTYELKWDCGSGYNKCHLTFKQYKPGSEKITLDIVLDKNNTEKPWQGELIEGFKHGYQIVFTQHYNSINSNDYDKFKDHYSEMLIHSLEISNNF